MTTAKTTPLTSSLETTSLETTSLDLTFPAADGHELAATLELPDGEGPHPAVLLIVGSGEVDRDSDHPRLALGVTRELAGALAGAGIASLRYDKRGVGASGGEYLETTFTDARADATLALTALRCHPAVDGDRVLVIGHSEGALHAASVAADDPTLAGVGLLACPATTGEATLRWQAERLVPTLPAAVRLLLRVLRQSPERAQAKLFARVRATDGAVQRIQGRKLNVGWLRGFLDHDPTLDLARVRVPVLALTGALDLQVDPDDLERIAELVAAAPVQTHRIPQVNHTLRHSGATGAPSEYKRQVKAGQPLDPRVLHTVTGWARHRVSVPA